MAEVDKRRAVAAWLAAQGKREELDEASLANAQQLFTELRPGFGVLWSLIMFDRAMDLEELKNTNLGTPAGVARASELQGQIKAVDRMYETLLSIADPTVQG